MTDNKRAEILKTAENLINGDRAQSYGPPERSFSRIASLWTAMGMGVQAQGPDEDIRYRDVNATDVALALIQLKAARLVASPDHEDSWVDIAGYAGLGGEIALSCVRESDGLKEDAAENLPEVNNVVMFKRVEEIPAYFTCQDCSGNYRLEDVTYHARSHHDKIPYILDPEEVVVTNSETRPYLQISFVEGKMGRRSVWRCSSCDAILLSRSGMGLHADLHKATVFTVQVP